MASPKEDLIRNLRNESLELEGRIQLAEDYLQKHPEDGQVYFYQGDLLYRRDMQKRPRREKGFSKACNTLLKARDNLETEKEKEEAQRFFEIVILSEIQRAEDFTEKKREGWYSFMAKSSIGETSQAACLWLAQLYGSKENPEWEKAGHYASEYLDRKKKDPDPYAAVPVAKKLLKETGLIDEKGEYTTKFDSEKFKELALGIEPVPEKEKMTRYFVLLDWPHTYKVQVLLAMELLKSGHEEEAALSLEKAYHLVRQLGEEQHTEAEAISAALPELMKKAMRKSSQPEEFAMKMLGFQWEQKQSLDLEASLRTARAYFRRGDWCLAMPYYEEALLGEELPKDQEGLRLQISSPQWKIVGRRKGNITIAREENQKIKKTILPKTLDAMLEQGDMAALLFALYMTKEPNRLNEYYTQLKKIEGFSKGRELCRLVYRLNQVKEAGVKYFRKKSLVKVFGYNPLEIKNENPIFKRIQKKIEEDLVRKFLFERKGKRTWEKHTL